MEPITTMSATTAPTQPKTLHQEFSLVNFNIRNIIVDSMDPDKRTCTLTANANGSVAALHISFPANYPHNIAPIFQFAAGTTVDSATKAKLLKVLKQTSMARVKKNRSCLEPCIRQFVTQLEQLTQTDEPEKAQISRMPESLLQQSRMYNSFPDAFIPFPRTSGAKFSGVDILVCFGCTVGPRNSSSRSEQPKPRALSELSNFSESPITLSSFYYHDRGQTRSRVGRGMSRGRSYKTQKAAVVVFDASGLFPIQRDLAEKYVLDSTDVPGMCQKNSAIAGNLGRKDLAQAWSLAALAATPPTTDLDEDFPWAFHPLSIGMIHSLISHYAKQSDIQTAAMLCCAFGTKCESNESLKNKNLTKGVNISPGGSPYHTIHQVDSSMESWVIPVMKQNRSNSWSESLDDTALLSNIVEHFPLAVESDKSRSHICRVALDDYWLYEQYKLSYAEILHRWRLLDARAQVMKYVMYSHEPHRGVELVTECPTCKKSCREPQCSNCKKLTFQCIICHTSIKGGANACLVCGHGGHTQHMREWFATNNECATGCGCQCLTETAALFDP
ncbi:hypothetical protein AAG570_001000 [Ranatra chinensis]|uniref:RWD domain-containing protein n=1 Tax=Ranatra chinensis TaxID=642074 RepID=A0ABD0YAT3_9HEMI